MKISLARFSVIRPSATNEGPALLSERRARPFINVNPNRSASIRNRPTNSRRLCAPSCPSHVSPEPLSHGRFLQFMANFENFKTRLTQCELLGFRSPRCFSARWQLRCTAASPAPRPASACTMRSSSTQMTEVYQDWRHVETVDGPLPRRIRGRTRRV